MPDIGLMEMLVIAVVALIVVGPKDLPMMFRKFGQYTGKIRAMARDFTRAMEDAAEDSGMKDMHNDLKTAARYTSNPKKAGMDALKETMGDLDLDPENYDEGSETRRMAETKSAEIRARREQADALRKANVEKTIADKKAAAPVEPAAPAAAEPDPAPEPPATTGADRT